MVNNVSMVSGLNLLKIYSKSIVKVAVSPFDEIALSEMASTPYVELTPSQCGGCALDRFNMVKGLTLVEVLESWARRPQIPRQCAKKRKLGKFSVISS